MGNTVGDVSFGWKNREWVENKKAFAEGGNARAPLWHPSKGIGFKGCSSRRSVSVFVRELFVAYS